MPLHLFLCVSILNNCDGIPATDFYYNRVVSFLQLHLVLISFKADNITNILLFYGSYCSNAEHIDNIINNNNNIIIIIIIIIIIVYYTK